MHVDPNLLYVAGVSIGANIDNFGVALGFGISRRRLSVGSNLFIALVSVFFCIVASAGAFGLSHFVTPRVSGAISGSILVGIGLWGVADLLREVRTFRARAHVVERPLPFMQPIGFPQTAMVAVALALNAGVAGFATGFAGRPLLATAAGVGFCSFVAIVLGQWSARRMYLPASPLVTQAIGAAVLVTIGIFQFS